MLGLKPNSLYQYRDGTSSYYGRTLFTPVAMASDDLISTSRGVLAKMRAVVTDPRTDPRVAAFGIEYIYPKNLVEIPQKPKTIKQLVQEKCLQLSIDKGSI